MSPEEKKQQSLTVKPGDIAIDEEGRVRIENPELAKALSEAKESSGEFNVDMALNIGCANNLC